MALPDYFGRNAVAVSQAISGLDELTLHARLEDVVVGIRFGPDAKTSEGAALADLLTRLLARLYPRLSLRSAGAPKVTRDMEDLARRINPLIDLGGVPTIEVIVGTPPRLDASPRTRIFVGSNNWEGHVATTGPLRCGTTPNPVGPGLAACLAAANVFRYIFLPNPQLDTHATLSPLEESEVHAASLGPGLSLGNVVLVGAGAIGNAAAWTLARAPLEGVVHIVDHEDVDLGNLQRYVLAERTHVAATKAPLLAQYFGGALEAKPFCTDLATYLQDHGYDTRRMLLALDSAQDRRAAQASLPQWIANAWTQPGDVGISTHDFARGACVSCLYLPDGPQLNEDDIIARAFGIPNRVREVRSLLFLGEGAPRGLLDAIAEAHHVDLDRLLPFEGRPLRSLYVEGFCGGAVIALDQAGTPRGDVHVPLAHQSALAGVLLAAAALRNAFGGACQSRISQINLLKALPALHSRPAAKHPSGRCICQDSDYQQVYAQKYA